MAITNLDIFEVLDRHLTLVYGSYQLDRGTLETAYFELYAALQSLLLQNPPEIPYNGQFKIGQVVYPNQPHKIDFLTPNAVDLIDPDQNPIRLTKEEFLKSYVPRG